MNKFTKNTVTLAIVVATMFLFTSLFSGVSKVSAAGGENCTVGAYGITTCAPTGIIFKDGNDNQLSVLDVVAIGLTFTVGVALILNGKFIKNKLVNVTK